MIEQVFICTLGVLAIFLSQQKEEELRKWACIAGMASQPFWFYATYKAEQWGIFGISFLYAYSWWLGIKNYWLT